MSDRVIGGYALRRVLGRGGMGEVHLATTPTGGLAAVKIIHAGLARDPVFRRRFEREVAAARRVARFCTAPVLDAGLDGDVAYLVTEYVKGPDLAQAVRDQGPLSGGNLDALAVGIATALSAIHAAGVIHRDLKPSNVLLSPLGPRVIDFGIAQLVGSDTSQAVVGTPAFMAPEQARGESVGPHTDVFAWGGVIAFAGTGRPPFGGGSPGEVIHRITTAEPNLDGLDSGVRGLVEQALAKDPRARPSVSRLLAELLGGVTVSPASATEAVERTWTVPVPRPSAAPDSDRDARGSGGGPGWDARGSGGGWDGDRRAGGGSVSQDARGSGGGPGWDARESGGGWDGDPRAGGGSVSRDAHGSGGGPGWDARAGGGGLGQNSHVDAAGSGPYAPVGSYGEGRGVPPAAEGHAGRGLGSVEEAVASTSGGVYGGGTRARGGRRRWRWVVGAVLAVAVAGAGVAVAVSGFGAEAWPYESDFADGWEVGGSEAGTARREGSGYVLAVEDGWRLWKSAPRREPEGGVVVSARARLVDGAGAYGVWCRGTSGDRYEFAVGGGQVTIVKRRAGRDGVVLYGPETAENSEPTETAENAETGESRETGENAETGESRETAENAAERVVAECAGERAVTLRMWVNERLVAEVTDAVEPLGAGLAGVHAAPEAGRSVRVRFESFALRPARG